MIKKIVLFVITTVYLYAGKHSLILENDVVNGTDEHYTNGLFYTWMSNDDDLAISFTHLTFTPGDLSSSDVIVDDMPYAGYMNLSAYFYQSDSNFFHEIGAGIGLVGPKARAGEMQNKVHLITGNQIAQGWDNQLDNDYTINASYHLGAKTNIYDLRLFMFDWISSARVDVGNFYTGALVGTTIRIGSYLPENFKTTGNFIGGDESSLLNYKKSSDFAWSISYGVFFNSIHNFYVVDEAEEYEVAHIDYTKGEVFTINIYNGSFEFGIKMKQTYLHDELITFTYPRTYTKWGGLTFKLILD